MVTINESTLLKIEDFKNPTPKAAESTKNTSTADSPNSTYQRPERTTKRKKRILTPLSTEQNASENSEATNSYAEPKPAPSKTTAPKPQNENSLNLSWSTIAMFVAGLYLLYKLLN